MSHRHLIEIYDAWRYLTIGMGIALLLISGWSLCVAYQHAYPRRLRMGLTLRWLGRLLLTVFGVVFILHRLHHNLNWYTPLVFTAFAALLAGNWLMRKELSLWQMIKITGQPEPVVREERDA